MHWEASGRVAVVTGASSGIGEATARRLARAGMTVVAVARRGERLDELARRQPSIVPHVADVRSRDDVRALVDRVASSWGACHALVNNAGVRGEAFDNEADLDAALATIDINLNGAVRCMALFADLLAASAPSRVVNVASIAGKLGVGPAAYAASKFGLVGLSEATSFTWAGRGVTVSQLNPGFVETEGFPQTKFRDTPLERLVIGPEQVARAVHRTLIDGAPERSVPSWYRAIVVARHTAAPIYRLAASRAARLRDREIERDTSAGGAMQPAAVRDSQLPSGAAGDDDPGASGGSTS